MVSISLFSIAFSPLSVVGHGVMYEPPVRNSLGLTFPEVSCAGGSCQWFNQGCTIGCKNVSGKSGLSKGGVDCEDHAEPTIQFEDKNLRTYAIGEVYHLRTPWHDWTKYHPWRYPGSAPVADPCGVAGGSFEPGSVFAGILAPLGVPQGSKGTEAPYNLPLLAKTVWIAGSTAEVAWAIDANHGGGYQYRLCPAGVPQTEACFQANTLKFVGETQWLQFGGGMNVNNRTEIPATTVPGDKVVPKGSTWRKNPIPACNSPISGGSGVWRRDNGVAIGLRTHKWNKNFSGAARHDLAYFFSAFCDAPTFEPPLPDLFGFGGSACNAEYGDRKCTHEERLRMTFDFGIVDKVEVPIVPAGDYTLSWRWDTEQTAQVWTSCADVTIKANGPTTKPFTTKQGCDICCPEKRLPCSNCTQCLNDKSGACAYCWDPLPGASTYFRTPEVSCLGHEAEDGGAPFWETGMSVEGGWSPGCPKCWSDENSCKPHFREMDVQEMVV